MVKYNLSLLVALAASSVSSTAAFVVPPPKSSTSILQKSRLAMSSTNSATTTRPKRTIRDRSSEEAVSLLRDIVQAAYDAGPRGKSA